MITPTSASPLFPFPISHSILLYSFFFLNFFLGMIHAYVSAVLRVVKCLLHTHVDIIHIHIHVYTIYTLYTHKPDWRKEGLWWVTRKYLPERSITRGFRRDRRLQHNKKKDEKKHNRRATFPMESYSNAQPTMCVGHQPLNSIGFHLNEFIRRSVHLGRLIYDFSPRFPW